MTGRTTTYLAALTILAGSVVGLTPGFAQRSAKLNDAQIAHIAYTAGDIDIKNAKLALTKTHNKEVRDFADDMVRDHSAVNDKALALVKKLHVTPEDNPTSQALVKQADAERAKLGALNGAAFDKAYADNEVAYHQQVLDAIDKVLIPSAQNAELKGLIEKVRPAIQAHLDHAKHVQADLGKSS
jgi:putative membrane protein